MVGVDEEPGRRSLLLIADIGGYTKFMRLHRISLAHAEVITRRLLQTLVDGSPLPLIEIEGDAAFFCAPLADVEANPMALSLRMHQAFHSQLARMIALQMCSCDACLQSRDLSVKFVGHVGEVATQTIGGRESVIGVDVITVHRLLKNAVPVREYLLMTESLADHCGADVQAAAGAIQQDLEGLGATNLRFVDIAAMALPPRPPPPQSLPRRLGETARVGFGGMPMVLGIRRPRRAAI